MQSEVMTSTLLLVIGLCASMVLAFDPMEDPELFQGDMVLTEEQKNAYLNGEANAAVPLAAVKSGLWPTTIPYTVDKKLMKYPKALTAINNAIDDYHKTTCLRFVKRTNEKGYIDFYLGRGCSSPVGYYGSRNGISLADGCWHKGIVMHEIAHSLGFYHEQSRPDRDHYVIIHWKNIKRNMQYNFQKQKASNIDSMSVPYDYKSIMHYGRTAFGSGKLTIETRDSSMQRVIGRRSGFSELDALQMNLLYKCPGFTRPPKQSLPPITKVVPTTAPFTGKCQDKSRSCSYYKGRGYCTKDIWISYMTNNCAKTCGICRSDDIVLGSEFADACIDTIHFCDFYITRGYCSHPDFGSYMKRNCPLSCKFCKPGVATQPPLVTKAPVTVPFTTPDCMDTIHYCDHYNKKGYCSDERFIDYMTRNCPKTCGMCEPGEDVSGKSFADACMDTIHYCKFYEKKGYCSRRKDGLIGDYMQRNCPRTCKFCKPGVATQPPLVTRPPVTVPFTTPDCMDTIHYCDHYDKQGYCSDERFIDYMTRNCPKTCGMCEPAVPSEDIVFADACIDTITYCKYYVDKGYCNISKFAGYMKKNCPLSCKHCKPGEATQPPLVTRTPKTVPFTTPDCMDTITYCDHYKKKKYCTDRFVNYMRRNCPKTCGFCTGGGGQATTAPSVVTNPPSAAPAGGCGLPEVSQGRVIAGENAPKGAWPWQILMLFMNSPMCGGALIAPDWVLTAAHCVSGRSTMRFKIRVGEHQFTTSSEGRHTDIQVQKIIPHPSYSRKTLDNDIALMKLARPAKFGKYVKPVCLPDHKQDVPVGTQCFITGWGKIRHPGRMHHTLQQGKMPVVDNSDCSKLNTKNLGITITKNMVCAGHGGSTRVSGCHGDSGGPFVCQTGQNGRWVLHGAVSWGSGRCDAKVGYTVFARVSEYKQWIDNTMTRS